VQVMFVLAGLGTGGAERVVSLIAGHWADQGRQVAVVAFDSESDPVSHRFHQKVELIRLGVPPGNGSALKGAKANVARIAALRALLKERSPQVVISFLTKINVICLLAAAGLRIPVVVSERNNPHAQAAHPLWTWAWTRLAARASAIVLQTEAIRQRYPARIARRAAVIPNPVEAPATRREHKGKVMAAVGRLVEQKGFDLLIAAYAQVAAEFPEWRLVIWGEGPERDSLEEQVRQVGLQDAVQLPGVSPSPGSWIESADAFVLSSRYEGFPNVLVEAMLAGIPSVAFDCSYGPGEIMTHEIDGLLVPVGNIEQLALAMRRIMANDTLALALHSTSMVNAQRFKLARIVPIWDGLLHKLLYSA
jgi:glycosyltransferase involved in cell wall biosynthesis